jgi:hypothetical protein
LGVLQCPGGERLPLRARHLVGRSRSCHLRLERATVSAEHAVLWWTGERWLVRDLGSRNGTWVDGERLEPLSSRPLPQGAALTFGLEAGYQLVEDGAPRAFAVGEDEGALVVGTPDLLELPDEQDPAVSLLLTEAGWRMEGSDEPLPPEPALEARGRRFRVSLPDRVLPTLEREETDAPPSLGLKFVLDPDGRLQELLQLGAQQDLPLKARSHGETLLWLARARLEDRARGLPEEEQGWVYLPDVLQQLRLTESALNVHVFRARQQLGDHRVIERRLRTLQLRLGLVRLEVVGGPPNRPGEKSRGGAS